MRRKLAIVLCIALVLCMIPTTSVFAAKKVKAKSVSVAPKEMTLAVGDVAQLKATKKPSNATGKLTWTSSDNSIATVTKSGLVKAVSPGTAVITVKTTSKKKAKCTVTVKEYAEKDEISTLISQNTYSKSELDKKFAEIPAGASCGCAEDIEAMKTKVSEIAEKAYVTKDDVESLISEKTYTKAEVDEIIGEIQTSNSADFEDGDSLALYSGQSIPITINSGDSDLTISSISIKKYHYNQFRDGRFSPFCYELEIKGVKKGIPSNASTELRIGYLTKDRGSGEERYYMLKDVTGTSDNVEQTYSTDGNGFTLKVKQYYMNADYAYFFINNFDSYIEE